ncbi:MAG: hypothetical protein JXB30_17405 [Anaerolineae bacterium]|nr:hypothetical protein [Anaerolineae bacterium]
MALDQIIKRNGQKMPFDRTRIERAIWAAANAANAGESRLWAETLSGASANRAGMGQAGYQWLAPGCPA